MEYPSGLSPDSQARVYAEEAKAERNFSEAKRSLGSFNSAERYQGSIEEFLQQYISCVLFAFAHEAIETAKKGIWTINQIQPKVEEFCEAVILAAESKRCYRNGVKFPPLTPWNFRDEVWGRIRDSNHWLAFLDEVAVIATQTADGFLPHADSGERRERRASIEAFILKVAESGCKITRKNIWTVAGYHDPTEFQRFQRGDTRTTSSAARAFNRVLKMTPSVMSQ